LQARKTRVYTSRWPRNQKRTNSGEKVNGKSCRLRGGGKKDLRLYRDRICVGGPQKTSSRNPKNLGHYAPIGQSGNRVTEKKKSK